MIGVDGGRRVEHAPSIQPDLDIAEVIMWENISFLLIIVLIDLLDFLVFRHHLPRSARAIVHGKYLDSLWWLYFI